MLSVYAGKNCKLSDRCKITEGLATVCVFRWSPAVGTPYYQKANAAAGVVLPIMGSMGSFTWEAVEWLLSVTRLPVVLKGIMNPDDADQAIRTGAAGIIVSNHGGRCLDTLPASINALEPVVQKV